VLDQGLPLEAAQLGSIKETIEQAKEAKLYDPAVYRDVWEHICRHRPTEVLPMEHMMKTEDVSAYDYDCSLFSIQPSLEDVSECFELVLKRFKGLSSKEVNSYLKEHAAAWFVT
jgi:hypothetical protein